MKTKKILGFLFFSVLALILIGAASVVFRSPTSLPNVILVSIDTLRADHLGCYGYPRNTSPHLDSLARESLLFENAISQAGYTLPSYMALFTSQFPNENRIAKGKEGFQILEDRTTLAEYLKGAGYKTCGMVDGGWLREKFGFSQGFDLYIDDVWNPQKSILDGGEMEQHLFPWLEENRKGPFFLFLYSIRYVHGPYEPPLDFGNEFLSDSLYKGDRQVPVSDFKAKEHSKIPGYQSLEGSTDVDLYIAKYDGEIRYMDSRMGALIENLKSLGVFDNTLFIFTADHGESMDEHHWFFDHGVVYNTVIRVPLIMRYPPLFKEGMRIKEYVHLIDILPTLAGILNIPLKEEEIRGKSLLPLILEGKEVNPVTFSGHGNMNPFSIRQGKWKLIFKIPAQSPEWSWESMPGLLSTESTRPHIELYDLEEDPGETRNLMLDGAYRGKVKELFLKLTRSVDFSLKNTFRGGEKKPHLDPSTEEQLKKLGYFVE